MKRGPRTNGPDELLKEWFDRRAVVDKPWNLPLHHTVDERGVVTVSLQLHVQADLSKASLEQVLSHAQSLFKEEILACARGERTE